MTPVFPGIIEAGKFVADEPRRLKNYIAAEFGSYNRKVELIIRKQKSKRSTNQNNYYWGVVIRMVADAMGLIDDDAHEFVKRLFLKRVIKLKQKQYYIAKSTTSLNTQQFEDYLERVRQWAALELEIVVPLPNEVELE